MNSNTQIETLSLSFKSLKQCYKNNVFTAVDVVNEIFRRINTRGEDGVWTFVLKQSEVLQRAKDLMDMDAASLPLYGIPFCVREIGN